MMHFNDIDFNKVEQFALNELNFLEKETKLTLIIPEGNNVYRIKDWKITVKDKDTVECKKVLCDALQFANKSCAILYIINCIRNQIDKANEIKNLDDKLLRIKSDARLLSHQMKRKLKNKDFQGFELLHNQYLEAQNKYKIANETVKKYFRNTKYIKGY
jgi:hypothetical protein